MKKFLAILSVVAMVLTFQVVAFASPAGIAAAENYVKAFEAANWAQAKSLSSDAALSFVEYCEIAGATGEGVKSIVTSQVETITDGTENVRVVYLNNNNQYRVRNVSVANRNGKFLVTNDKPMGSEWVSTGYITDGFKTSSTTANVKVTVVGYLEIGNIWKIDLIVENVSTTNTVYAFPSLDAFARLEINGTYNLDYSAVVPNDITDKPLAPGQSMRSSVIVQNWQYDENLNAIASQIEITSLKLAFYVPVGPLDNVVIYY